MMHAQGDTERAMMLLEKSLTLRQERGDKHGMIECLEGLAGSAIAQRQLEQVAQLLGAAAALREATGAALSPKARARTGRNLCVVQVGLGEAVFAAAWTTGQGTTMDPPVVRSPGDCTHIRTPRHRATLTINAPQPVQYNNV